MDDDQTISENASAILQNGIKISENADSISAAEDEDMSDDQ